MKKEDLIVELKKAVPEGVEIDIDKLNVDGLNTAINLDTNNVVASKKEEFSTLGVNSFLKDKGFDNVEAFDQKVELFGKDETKMSKDLEKAQNDLKAVNLDFTKLKGEVSETNEMTVLTGKGDKQLSVKSDFGKFVRSEVNALRATKAAEAKKEIKDIDFHDTAKEYLEKNQHYIDTFSTGRGYNGGNHQVSNEQDYLDKKYGKSAFYNKGKKD